jgi:ribosome-associated protein
MMERAMRIPITPTFAIDDRDFDERFVRASGPGGQNVNKVATAVELRVELGRVSWPPEIVTRLRDIAGARLTQDDVLLIDSRAHRTQGQNREAARERLVDLLVKASRRPRTRKPGKATRASQIRRLETKRVQGERKRARSRQAPDD